MLLGLYLAMPLLSPWAEKVGRRELSGWILLWLFTTSFPFLRRLWTSMYGAPPFGAVPYLYGECPWNGFGAFQYVGGFFGYVLIGLWFRKFYAPQGWARTLAIALPLWATVSAFIVMRKIDFAGGVYRFLVRPISEASYEMYLMHMFILPVAFEAFGRRLPTPLCILATAAAAFAASAAVSVLIRRVLGNLTRVA